MARTVDVTLPLGPKALAALGQAAALMNFDMAEVAEYAIPAWLRILEHRDGTPLHLVIPGLDLCKITITPRQSGDGA